MSGATQQPLPGSETGFNSSNKIDARGYSSSRVLEQVTRETRRIGGRGFKNLPTFLFSTRQVCLAPHPTPSGAGGGGGALAAVESYERVSRIQYKKQYKKPCAKLSLKLKTMKPEPVSGTIAHAQLAPPLTGVNSTGI